MLLPLLGFVPADTELLLLLVLLLLGDVDDEPPFGPRGGILSSTFDFFVTVRVLLDCDT